MGDQQLLPAPSSMLYKCGFVISVSHLHPTEPPMFNFKIRQKNCVQAKRGEGNCLCKQLLKKVVFPLLSKTMAKLCALFIDFVSE